MWDKKKSIILYLKKKKKKKIKVNLYVLIRINFMENKIFKVKNISKLRHSSDCPIEKKIYILRR
ncbi:hypothetical protein PFFVO_05405 [Plasmodium falciparum Vietnam Oak-Knoll (FVO)]|uniref:Uncharacterized protein n=1 Tax=Plasmodium falciparum Vietnam Oak-Knoll (FVO) TaxID=1036723 RepID=A0A024V087_PLAFA|nr:hypothetical protein PFFVO_05405 [Plasmodium falciparum Vietnam Oak-Knoll (FVO)]